MYTLDDVLTFPKQPGVYVFINKSNGKRYIGSALNLYNRFRQYKTKLRKNQRTSKHLQNAWNKYGEENFIIEILQTFPVGTPEQEVRDAEAKEFEKYSWDELYNIATKTETNAGWNQTEAAKDKMRTAAAGRTYGPLTEEHKQAIRDAFKRNGHPKGMKGKKHSEETKAKMREKNSGEGNPRYGKTLSEETKQKISKARKGQPATFKGKTHSEETKAKIRQSRLGKSTLTEEGRKKISEVNRKPKPFSTEHRLSLLKALAKPVQQISLETNEIIAEFISVTEAAKQTNSDVGKISSVATGKRKSHNGFGWRYL